MISPNSSVLNYPLLEDEEIRTLQIFLWLERWRCENDHEVCIPGKSATQRVQTCIHRKHLMVVSCVHTEEGIFGKKGANDILKQTVIIFWKADQKMRDKIWLYQDLLRIFDFIRQALEWYDSRLIDNINTFKSLSEEFPEDTFLTDVIKLAEDYLESCKNIEISDLIAWNNPKWGFLVRFRSLKNTFSSEWEPKILEESKRFAQEILDHQSD